MSYYIHGKSGTPEYKAWRNMLTRCYNSNYTNYRHWGGRGIKVCDRWRNSSTVFLKDMGKRPTPKHTLDRIDNDKDYSPENCRWVTRSVSLVNTRTSVRNTSGHRGVTWNKHAKKWEARFKNKYLGLFSTTDEARKAYQTAKDGVLYYGKKEL